VTTTPIAVERHYWHWLGRGIALEVGTKFCKVKEGMVVLIYGKWDDKSKSQLLLKRVRRQRQYPSRVKERLQHETIDSPSLLKQPD